MEGGVYDNLILSFYKGIEKLLFDNRGVLAPHHKSKVRTYHQNKQYILGRGE